MIKTLDNYIFYLTIFVVRYDMMIGVTSAEAFILLNSVEMELGLETESRNKLVSDLVMILIIGVLMIIIIITGDRHLQPPHEGDLLGSDHRVHGLGQRGPAPHHHQGRDN